jgi:hypothetical protein
MKKIKILVDRIEPSKEDILKRRNFDEVIQRVNRSKSLLRSPWFYGAIGFSSMLGLIFYSI